MKILVTGSKGFLGKYVVNELEKNGHEIVHFDIKDGPEYDLRHAYFKRLEGCDAVVHLAAYVGLVKCFYNPVEGIRTNILGTTRLLEAIKQENDNRKSEISSRSPCEEPVKGPIKFIFASTWAVNGKKINPYDITKKTCEHMIYSYNELHGLPYSILRFGTAYGPNMREEGVIQNFIKKAKAGLPLEIHGRGEQIRQFTHARDIARGVRLACESKAIGRWDITSPEVVSIKEIAEMFGEKIDYKPARAQDEDYEVIPTSPAMDAIGYRAIIKLKDGIEEMRQQ